MVREAALLGLNAYSIFAGKLGAADAALAKRGLLKMLREPEEVEGIEIQKFSGTRPLPNSTSPTRDFVSREIERFITEYSTPKVSAVHGLERPSV